MSRNMRTPEEKNALLDDYFSLAPGRATAWLKEHRISHKQINRWKEQAKQVASNGQRNRQPKSPTTGMTLAQAVAALEAKIAAYQDVLDDLKRIAGLQENS